MNVVLGGWVVASAFLWPHVPAARLNAEVAGVLIVAVALAATRVARVHWLNAAVALWLFATVWLVPHASEASRFNDGVCAFVILVVALVPGAGETDGEAAAPQRARA
jgi:hypothetical protein